jgi:hypothetical protein
MLGHSSVEQTSTYLNVQRGGLRESMRRIDEVRSRCNPVAIESTADHPMDRNEEAMNADKVTVN